jgi:hypothetical protein
MGKTGNDKDKDSAEEQLKKDAQRDPKEIKVSGKGLHNILTRASKAGKAGTDKGGKSGKAGKGGKGNGKK